MLIEFSVKNFLSFKNKVTLSMEKGNGDENLDNIISTNNLDLLKTAAIYGANASGKSNILKAFTCAILMVRTSSLIPVGGKWNFIKPFLFDEKSKNRPSEFEFIFMANDVKYRYFFSADTKTRFRPSHFPFTEPSVEVDASCSACGGKGCRVCKGEGFIEILGAGMVHPKVLANCGIDPEVYSGFAFGLGLERIVMRSYGIDDMRHLYENDLRFLKQF